MEEKQQNKKDEANVVEENKEKENWTRSLIKCRPFCDIAYFKICNIRRAFWTFSTVPFALKAAENMRNFAVLQMKGILVFFYFIVFFVLGSFILHPKFYYLDSLF